MAASDKKEPLVPKSSTELSAEEFDALSYRDRFRAYFEEAAGANYTLPICVILVYTVITGAIWFAAFWFLVRDASKELFSEYNIRKFILYNILHGVLGFGAASGPLGVKFKMICGNPMAMMLTPGTLCSPLLPSVVGCFQKTPGRRSLLHVLAYVVYVATLVYATMDPTAIRVTYANAALAVATVLDFTVFLVSRGEHYGYMMICMSFPDWIAGCQWVQLMLWIFVGFSKCGPWFQYVIQVLVKDAIWTPCLPKGASARFFNKDFDNGDFRPSTAARLLGHLGALGEWGFPLCAVIGPPGSLANSVGVWGMIAYHSFIWCTMPTASVFEWQYFTIVMTWFLYRVHPFALPTSLPLIGILAIVLLVFPIVGQFKPTLIPFLLAYRQYAGNWRMGTFMLRKSAKEKFKRLKTYENIFYWENAAAPPEMGGERAEYKIAASFMVVPQFRGQFSVMEKFFVESGENASDFDFIGSFVFANAVNGWNLGGGWEIYRECWREAFVEVCGLEAGEAYFLMAEPVQNLPPHTLAYRLMDMAKGPYDAEVYAEIPYAELENVPPLDVHLKPERMTKGKSVKGTCLGTYYI